MLNQYDGLRDCSGEGRPTNVLDHNVEFGTNLESRRARYPWWAWISLSAGKECQDQKENVSLGEASVFVRYAQQVFCDNCVYLRRTLSGHETCNSKNHYRKPEKPLYSTRNYCGYEHRRLISQLRERHR
jgi:hypothetical protein